MNKQPPKYASRFLRWFCREDFIDEIEGDLIEIFEHQYKETPRRANWLFIWQVLLHFRPDFIKSFNDYPLIYPGMLKHNFVVTLRHFTRNKTSFLINLIGLSTGLACTLLIYMWVQDEVSMDKFHQKDERLYTIMQNVEMATTSTGDNTPYELAQTLKEEMPEVEYAVATNDFFNWNNKYGIVKVGESQLETKGLHAGEDFFHVFSYPLIEGNRNQVLADKNGVVISSSLAIQLFGENKNIIGKSLEWQHIGYDGVFQITGVFEDPPSQSTTSFDLLFNLDLLDDNDPYAREWNGSYVKTYVVLKEGSDLAQFNEKIKGLMNVKLPQNNYSSLFAQGYSDRYLNGQYENGVAVGGRIAYVRLFSIIALFILLIACVNFMNLSTAKASVKMKEIGVKKTIGATRGNLISQFIGESMLLSILSMVVALLLVQLLLPQFNSIAGKQIHFEWDKTLVVSILAISIVTGLVAGSYPAFYLSSFDSSMILKGKFGMSFGEGWIRKGLVVFQFTLSIIFVVGLLVVHEQVQLAQTQNMGYNRDHIISFKWKGNLYDQSYQIAAGKSNEQFETFLQRLKKVPGVTNTTNMAGNILDEIYRQSGSSFFSEDEVDRNAVFQSPLVGYNFIETLGIELLAGRSFSIEKNDDYSKIILNESAAKLLNLENPVGKRLGWNDNNEVIGLVKDFHYGSLHHDIEPLFFRFEPMGDHIMVKLASANIPATLERIQQLHKEFLPGNSFDFSFMDEDYQALYEAENKVATLSTYFAGLAIIISCLGLFGLAAFTAERRRKEIGIRKILGSSVIGIIQMLTRDFTRTVLMAILIALPISYLIVSHWLTNFSQSIELSAWIFLAPAILVLVIAWGTVGLQTIKAAYINPVLCLKEE